MTKKIIYFIIIALIAINICTIYIKYDNSIYRADKEILNEYTQGNEKFSVKINEYFYEYIPILNIEAGIVFYPEKFVEAGSYVRLMSLLANENIYCVLCRLPYMFPPFALNMPDIPIKKYNLNWYVAGHGMGGAVAAKYVYNNLEDITGVIFLGSYPKIYLGGTGLKALSIIGSNDKIINKEGFEAAKYNLPANHKIVEISGGNHAGFANYGHHKLDGELKTNWQIGNTFDEIKRMIRDY